MELLGLLASVDPVPLVTAEGGRVIRVAGTRVTLDAVIGAFKRGATPEEIVQGYSAVALPEIYAVIAYYLRHQSEVEKYLERRTREHEDLRCKIEGSAAYQELRKRILGRARKQAEERE